MNGERIGEAVELAAGTDAGRAARGAPPFSRRPLYGPMRWYVTEVRELIAFWIEPREGLTPGFGVTARSLGEALDLLAQAGCEVDLATATVREHVTVAQLDPNHVVPNMGVIVRRGIWFPNLNSS